MRTKSISFFAVALKVIDVQHLFGLFLKKLITMFCWYLTVQLTRESRLGVECSKSVKTSTELRFVAQTAAVCWSHPYWCCTWVCCWLCSVVYTYKIHFSVMQLEDFGFATVFDRSYFSQVKMLKFATHQFYLFDIHQRHRSEEHLCADDPCVCVSVCVCVCVCVRVRVREFVCVCVLANVCVTVALPLSLFSTWHKTYCGSCHGKSLLIEGQMTHYQKPPIPYFRIASLWLSRQHIRPLIYRSFNEVVTKLSQVAAPPCVSVIRSGRYVDSALFVQAEVKSDDWNASWRHQTNGALSDKPIAR